MDKEPNKRRAHFVPIILCCFLLACAGIVYSIYTYREISWLKEQIRLHHKVIVALQERAHTSDFQGPPERSQFRGNTVGSNTKTSTGMPVTTMHSTDSAHMVGYGQLIENPRTMVNRITNWKLGHISGNMKFVENSFLEIGTTGYHFVYSQLFYCEGDTLFMGHYTFINDKSVMRSISSVADKNRKYNTNYQGAVFFLTKGDRISVRIPFKKCFSMNRETSYFGAFLITPVVNVTDSSTTGSTV